MPNLGDIGAFVANIATSVIIIFVNKLLMRSYGFNFAVTLSGLHYLAAALLMQAYKWTGLMTPKGVMPWNEILVYTGVSSVSIISLNVSLLLNTVGFYQIAKLCVIPFVCVVEYFAYSRKFSAPVVASINVVMMGVGLVTISNVAVNFSGLLIALLSIVAAGSQQLLCRHQQTTLGVTSNELLLYTAWPMAALLLLIGPAMDSVITQGNWVFDFPFSGSNIIVIVASCTLAVGVNLSQFACLGRFTAVAYQVMGHTKTICVLLGGFFFFQEMITMRMATGMTLAVLGMVAYGYYSNKEKQQSSSDKSAAPAPDQTDKSKVVDSETAVLLSPQDSNGGLDGVEGGKLSPVPSTKLKD